MKAKTAITQAYLILLMTVFLFFTGSAGYMKISESKFRAFTLISVGYIAAIAAVTAADIIRGRSSPLALLRSSTHAQRAAVLYLTITWISAVMSPYWPDTVIGASRYEGAFTITLYVAAFLLISAYGRADRLLLWVFAGAVALESILCIVQMEGYNPFTLYPSGYNYFDAGVAYNGAYLGTIGNADMTAAFYCLAVPILAYGLARIRGSGRLILLAALVPALYAAVKMSVMAGYVGVSAGLMLAFPAGLSKRRTRIICWAALAAIILAGALTVYIADLPFEMFHQAHNILHGSFDGSFGSGRIHIWGQVLEHAARRPLLGFGPDTMINGGLEPFRRYSAELGGMIVAMIDTAHSEYLNILYHQGIFALAAYVWLLALLIKRWLKSSPADGAAWALGAGVLGYCAQAFFGFSTCIITPFFLGAAGLLESRRAAPDGSQAGRGNNVRAFFTRVSGKN